MYTDVPSVVDGPVKEEFRQLQPSRKISTSVTSSKAPKRKDSSAYPTMSYTDRQQYVPGGYRTAR